MDRLEQGFSRPVATWILAGVAMLVVQVILGGITRLTGSGLSITEWNVVTGVLPPLTDSQWLTEFDKYKQTSQYKLLNAGFTIGDFKFIFFWEWLHRLWARLIGAVFIIGFVWFLAKKYLKPSMIKPLLILFFLGALQGAIGWIMVKSGLTGDMLYVKPLKLALHFIFALGLICYAWWFALQLSVSPTQVIRNDSLRTWTWILVVLLFFQLMYGALMAGHKAASAAPTWPTINGRWVPDGVFSSIIKMIENKLTIHFMHRILAYLLVLGTIGWTVKARNVSSPSSYFVRTRWLPLLLIVLQMLLGIIAVLTSPSIVPQHWGLFDWIAQAHQVVAMIYLLTNIGMLYLVRTRKRTAQNDALLHL